MRSHRQSSPLPPDQSPAQTQPNRLRIRHCTIVQIDGRHYSVQTLQRYSVGELPKVNREDVAPPGSSITHPLLVQSGRVHIVRLPKRI
jgi:hypothetical protein